MITQVDLKFNTEMHRFEVFTDKSVMRRGELQPVFVSTSFDACVAYVEKAREVDE